MLQVQNLHFRYGDTLAVDDVSLELKAGGILGLLGPNGAGKTTLVSMVAGLREPCSGSVRVKGGNPRDPRVRSRLGLVPQELALYEELSAVANLQFFAGVQGLHGRVLKERVAWCLEFAGLSDRAKDKVEAFSGGMKRRLNLAVALLAEPELLVLDEPTVGVDPQSRRALLDRIHELRETGTAVLYTTHYMEEAQQLCDTVAIMDHGRLLAYGSVAELLERYGGESRLEITFADGRECLSGENPLGQLQALGERGKVLGMRLEQANLEHVFLELTGRGLRD